MQPGDTITPEPPKNQPEDTVVEPKIPRDNEQPTPQTTIATPVPDAPQPDEINSVDTPAEPELPTQPVLMAQTPETQPSWEYSQSSTPFESQAGQDPIVWTASEFVDHEKSASWFFGLAGVTVVVLIITFLLTRDPFTVVAITVAAALFGVTAKRKPHTLQYQLDDRGISVGDKFYGYEDFKSFSIVEESHFSSIQLMPLKRFGLPINLYYPPEEQDQLVTRIGTFLPHEKRKQDPVDRLMHKVRF